MIKTIEAYKKVLQVEDLEHCVQARAVVPKHTQTQRMSSIPSSKNSYYFDVKLKNTLIARKINQ